MVVNNMRLKFFVVLDRTADKEIVAVLYKMTVEGLGLVLSVIYIYSRFERSLLAHPGCIYLIKNIVIL